MISVEELIREVSSLKMSAEQLAIFITDALNWTGMISSKTQFGRNKNGSAERCGG